jgi:hypothetical protein
MSRDELLNWAANLRHDIFGTLIKQCQSFPLISRRLEAQGSTTAFPAALTSVWLLSRGCSRIPGCHPLLDRVILNRFLRLKGDIFKDLWFPMRALAQRLELASMEYCKTATTR